MVAFSSILVGFIFSSLTLTWCSVMYLSLYHKIPFFRCHLALDSLLLRKQYMVVFACILFFCRLVQSGRWLKKYSFRLLECVITLIVNITFWQTKQLAYCNGKQRRNPSFMKNLWKECEVWSIVALSKNCKMTNDCWNLLLIRFYVTHLKSNWCAMLNFTQIHNDRYC